MTSMCHKCGAELIAPDDGKPRWCIACSQVEGKCPFCERGEIR
jgi:hypothetical protein